MSMTVLDRHEMSAVPRSAAQPRWQDGDAPLPSIYLSHGYPGLLDDELWLSELFEWAMTMPKPRGVVVVSAHWENAPTSITSPTANTPLVYDFGGFEQRFYELTYPTPDASTLGARIAAMMPDSESLHVDHNRGLDHGAWVPLRAMYPLADVPALQVSMPTHSPERLMDLGRHLRQLRHEGYLVVGSGFMTHGMPSRQLLLGTTAEPESWSVDFDSWAAQLLDNGDVAGLSRFRTDAPGMPYAHPTVEHFTPLFITLGAADDPEGPVKTTVEGYKIGLSKRSFQLA